MKIILILIAIILIAVGGWFIVQHLQSRRHTQPRLADANKPLKVKRAEPSVDATPEQPDPLTGVDVYLHNQDYTSAIAELKRILMTNPRHTAAMLKLLQVYGVTKQYAAFNQLHQKIHQIADPKTVQEADFCKSLIDEEIASLNQQPAPEVKAKTLPADPAPNTILQTTSAAQTKADTDVLELITEEETQNTLNQTQSKPEEELILDFSTDFDDKADSKLSGNMAAVKTQAKEEPEMLLDLDFEFNDSAKHTVKPHESTIQKDDSFSLNGLTPDTDLTVDLEKSTSIHNAQVHSKDTLSDALEFDLTPPSQPTPNNTQTKEFSFDELSLDLDLDKPSKPASTNKPSPDFDTLSLTLDDSNTTAQNQTPDTIKKENDFDFATLDLDTKDNLASIEVQAAKAETIKTPTNALTEEVKDNYENGFDFTFDLDIDKPKTTADDVKTKISAQDLQEFTIANKDQLQHDSDELSVEFDFDGKDFQAPTQKVEHSTSIDTKDDAIDFEIPVIEVTPIRVETQIIDSPNNELVNDTIIATPATPTNIEFTTEESKPAKPEAQSAAELSLDDDLHTNKVADNQTDDFTFDNLTFDTAADKTSKADEKPIEIVISPEETPVAAEEAQKVIEIPVEVVLYPTETVSTAKNPDTSIQDTQTTEPALAPFGTPTIEDFGNLDDATDDSVEITLQLAKQYLQFGEYDSAKRLLTEVLNTGNTEQKASAQGLIVNLT